MLGFTLLVHSRAAWAEWQVRPFIGLTFGGGTTLVDLEGAAGEANFALGVSGGWVGEVIGFEADLTHAPGFFQSGDSDLVSSSRVTTFMGNVMVGPSRSASEYTLRPYIVGGFGLMHAKIVDSFDVLPVEMNRPATNIGGGVMGSLSSSIGVSWEIRYFRSLGGSEASQSIGPEELSFWRANMAMVFRF